MVLLTAMKCPKCGKKELFWNKCEACGTVFEWQSPDHALPLEGGVDSAKARSMMPEKCPNCNKDMREDCDDEAWFWYCDDCDEELPSRR